MLARRHGRLAFETPGLVAFCAYRNSQGGLGQFANPGYLHEAQWAAALEDEEPGEEGPGLLMCWKDEGAAWRLEFDRETGLVILTREVSQMPRDVQEMTAEVSAMCEAFDTWKAKLRDEPTDWRPRGEIVRWVPDERAFGLEAGPSPIPARRRLVNVQLQPLALDRPDHRRKRGDALHQRPQRWRSPAGR